MLDYCRFKLNDNNSNKAIITANKFNVFRNAKVEKYLTLSLAMILLNQYFLIKIIFSQIHTLTNRKAAEATCMSYFVKQDT